MSFEMACFEEVFNSSMFVVAHLVDKVGYHAVLEDVMYILSLFQQFTKGFSGFVRCNQR